MMPRSGTAVHNPVEPNNGHGSFTEISQIKLISSALPLDPAELEKLGITVVRNQDDAPDVFGPGWIRGPGMLLHDRQRDGSTQYRFRPDEPLPPPDEPEGDPVKSVGEPKGGRPTQLNHMREAAPGKPTLFAEGDFQTRAAARYAPADWGVVGIGGCWGWKGAHLTWAEGLDVVIFHDKDLSTNRHVYDAIAGLMEQLDAEGAESVKVAKLVGTRKDSDGIDDVLGYRPEESRAAFLVRMAERATDKLPKPPRRKASKYFDANGLLVRTLADAVLNDVPAALSQEGEVALYHDGVYLVDREAFVSEIADRLGDDHRSTYLESVKQSATARLRKEKRMLPDRQGEPVLNCRNAMLNLATGECFDHDPAYLSTCQIPVDWDPEAECPAYEAWLKSVCPDQIEDLEETFSAMLDPSCTPLKNPFLFGPSRSGKSTMLRITTAIVGAVNTSGITLHELGENRFKASDVYLKMLNAAGDLEGQDVKNLGLFRRLTGADVVSAERKHQRAFTFTNRALFAFSANDLPQVSGGRGAYFERIKPLRFGNSFAGNEDPEIERKIMGELPGLLVRLVTAWQRRNARGTYLPTAPGVRSEFETKSNRVHLFVSEKLEIIRAKTGSECRDGMSLAQVHSYFESWAESEKVGGLGRTRFGEWLKDVPGVTEVRIRGQRGFNVRMKRPEPANTSISKATGVPEDGNPGRVGTVEEAFTRGEKIVDQGPNEKAISKCGPNSADSAGPILCTCDPELAEKSGHAPWCAMETEGRS
ncbi:phage/plasmid primase, P4 family [Streptomyces sp. NPDC101175]|uniref:DNA primase family protein n=1 Tax=Streptomyces sp. NPDC101175 TaxID=3366123 RepID=UPI003834CF36